MRRFSLRLRAPKPPQLISLVLVVVAVAALSVPVARAMRATSGGGAAAVVSGAAMLVPLELRAPNTDGKGFETAIVRADGFHWDDAGIGAATAFAGMSLVGGVVLVSRSQRSTARPT